MKRGRPYNALGGTPRKDHLFENSRSLCGGWMYGGGREVDPADVNKNDDELCNRCASKVG